MSSNLPLCYNCKNEISATDKACQICNAAVLFAAIDQSVVEFMTEGTHPHMGPRSDNG